MKTYLLFWLLKKCFSHAIKRVRKHRTPNCIDVAYAKAIKFVSGEDKSMIDGLCAKIWYATGIYIKYDYDIVLSKQI